MARATVWLNQPADQKTAPDTPPDVVYEGSPQCDFCNETTIAARYDCPDFTTEGQYLGKPLTYVSVGQWAACPACAALIDAEDVDHLTLRVLVARGLFHNALSPTARAEQEAFHRRQIQQFFAERVRTPGEPVPLPPSPEVPGASE